MQAIEPYMDSQEPNLLKLLSIPSDERLPALKDKLGQKETHAHITALIQEFCNDFNVIRPMNPTQIVNTAYKMLTLSIDEKLSLHEVAVFLESAKSGKYGRILDRLDGPLLLSFFEKYLDDRWEFINTFRQNNSLKYKEHNPERTGEEKLLNNETMKMLEKRSHDT